MKKTYSLFLVICAFTLSSFAKPTQDDPPYDWFKKTAEVIQFQLNKKKTHRIGRYSIDYGFNIKNTSNLSCRRSGRS